MEDDVRAGVFHDEGWVVGVGSYFAGLEDKFSVDLEGWAVPCGQVGEFCVPQLSRGWGEEVGDVIATRIL